MGVIQKFEDVKAWQKARELCKLIFVLANKGEFAKDFSLRDQIKRSAGSAMDNIAEGFDRNTSGDFKRFLSIAHASASEVRSQLYRALDQNYITKDEFEKAYNLAKDVSNLIGGLMNYLRDKNYRKVNEESIEYRTQKN